MVLHRVDKGGLAEKVPFEQSPTGAKGGAARRGRERSAEILSQEDARVWVEQQGGPVRLRETEWAWETWSEVSEQVL